MGSKMTVLLPFRNSKAHLPGAIESVLRQTKHRWQLLLIDDASSDGYFDEIEPLLSDSRIELLLNAHPVGYSECLLRALDFADAPLTLCLDAKMRLPSDLIEAYIKKKGPARLPHAPPCYDTNELHDELWDERTRTRTPKLFLAPPLLEKPLVTVVVPTYNHAPYILHTLRSIHQQTFSAWKLLILDDASTDNTAALAKAYTDRYRTTIVRSEENRGVCHVLNEALRHIDTPYFVQVDGDDWLDPYALELLTARMEQEPPTTALAYGNRARWKRVGDFDLLKRILPAHPLSDRHDFITTPMVNPRFYRTACVQAVGGWDTDDPTNGRYMEDRRMMLRLLDEYTFAHVDRVLYHFRMHDTNLSHGRNAPVYRMLQRLYTERALERWNSPYRAEFDGPEDSWTNIRLVKKQP